MEASLLQHAQCLIQEQSSRSTKLKPDSIYVQWKGIMIWSMIFAGVQMTMFFFLEVLMDQSKSGMSWKRIKKFLISLVTTQMTTSSSLQTYSIPHMFTHALSFKMKIKTDKHKRRLLSVFALIKRFDSGR